MTIYPSSFSCVFRVNCSNEVRHAVILLFGPVVRTNQFVLPALLLGHRSWSNYQLCHGNQQPVQYDGNAGELSVDFGHYNVGEFGHDYVVVRWREFRSWFDRDQS
jgi:hypothetical protein